VTVIAYDQPVKDLVAQLSATGHVTHTAYTKTSVTLHHNGGRLSHEGVLQVWKTRPASAHFDVDGAGRVAQYVKVNEYAWAVGNSLGNQRSVSIEMANASLGPEWDVAEVTWKSAARLAGWLFFKVVGARPSSSNFFQHKHWSSTECAGPHIAKVWSQIMAEAQRWYDFFKGLPKPTTAPSKQTLWAMGSSGSTVTHIQKFLRDVFPAYKDSVAYMRGHLISVDGDFGRQTRAWVMEFQHRTNLSVDGVVGPNTFGQMRKYGYKY
jgi:peptidoglycan hydrolase-like protein with peptidoglycan-binding domain